MVSDCSPTRTLTLPTVAPGTGTGSSTRAPTDDPPIAADAAATHMIHALRMRAR